MNDTRMEMICDIEDRIWSEEYYYQRNLMRYYESKGDVENYVFHRDIANDIASHMENEGINFISHELCLLKKGIYE